MAEDHILSAAPEGSELERWAEEGTRRAPAHSNIVTFVHPEQEYSLAVEVDDPVRGFLIRMWTIDEGGRDNRVGQAVVDDRDLALRVAAQMAAGAPDLEAVDDNPTLGPETVHREDVASDLGGEELPPEQWDDEDQDEWEEALRDAFEEADIPRSKATLTRKEIDDREYYYLQWRDADKIRSQYVAPVNPS